MTAFISPVFGAGAQLFSNAGIVLSGGKLYTYLSGTTTPQATWTDSTQAVQNANPIILDSAGRVPNEIWLLSGTLYRFILQDSTGATIGTWDSISGISPATISQSEWINPQQAVTYVSATQFTILGNQAAVFTVNRRVQFTVNSGSYYGYVSASTYDGSTKTTVTIVNDSTGMDSSLSVVYYAFLSSVNTSVPQQYLPQVSYWCGTATGTANALTLTPANPVAAYTAGTFYSFKASASSNTAAATAAISGLTATAIKKNGNALIGGEIQANQWYNLFYDGAAFELAPITGWMASTGTHDVKEVTSATDMVLSNIGTYTYQGLTTVDLVGSVTVNIPATGIIRASFSGRVLNTSAASTTVYLGIRVNGVVFWFGDYNQNGTILHNALVSTGTSSLNDYLVADVSSVTASTGRGSNTLNIVASGMATGSQTINIVMSNLSSAGTIQGSVTTTRVILEIDSTT